MEFPNRLGMALGIHHNIVVSRRIPSLHAEIVQKDFRIANFFVISETNKQLEDEDIPHILEKFDDSNSDRYFHIDDIDLDSSILHVSQKASALSNREIAKMSESNVTLIEIEDNMFLLAHKAELDPRLIECMNKPVYIATQNYSPTLSVDTEMDIWQN